MKCTILKQKLTQETGDDGRKSNDLSKLSPVASFSRSMFTQARMWSSLS